MATYNSPGSYVIEKDFSEYPPAVGASLPGVVGFAARGISNKATLITSAAKLLRDFGRPDQVSGGQALQAALEILTRTNALYFVRCATDAALDASAAVQWGTCPAIQVAGIQASATWTFAVSSTDETGTINNPNGSDHYTFVVAASEAAGSAKIGGASAVVDAVAKLSDDNFPFTCVQRDASTVHFVGSHAGSATTLNVSAHTNQSINPAYGTKPYPIAPIIFSAGVPTDNAPVAGGEGDIWNPSLMEAVEGNPTAAGQGMATSAYGSTFVPSGAGGIYSARSLWNGAGYNYSSITKAGVTSTYGIHTKVVPKLNGSFNLEVYRDGGLEESYGLEMVKDGDSGNWPENVINVGNIGTLTSENIKGQFGSVGHATGDSVGEAWTPPVYWSSTGVAMTGLSSLAAGMREPRNGAAHNVANPEHKGAYLKAIAGVYKLTGGKNGDIGDEDGNINGDVLAALQGNAAAGTGLQALGRDDIDIAMACIPGITNQSVQNSLISLAESTQKFIAVVNPPEGLNTAQQAVNWHDGKADSRTAAINSSYAAIYWPWIKIFDTFSKSDMYLSPDAFAISVMCTTDIIADPWFAPAGLTRGRLTRPTDVEVSLNTGDRDSLYKAGNNINPIAKFATDGIVIWGQKTAQRNPSALDRLNVRRMMITVRKMILAATRSLVFEPNDTITWNRVNNLLNPAFADIKNRRGITEFRVICDDTVNTPVRVDRNELWCKVLIRPTKTAEVLIFEMNLTNQSADLGTA